MSSRRKSAGARGHGKGRRKEEEEEGDNAMSSGSDSEEDDDDEEDEATQKLRERAKAEAEEDRYAGYVLEGAEEAESATIKADANAFIRDINKCDIAAYWASDYMSKLKNKRNVRDYMDAHPDAAAKVQAVITYTSALRLMAKNIRRIFHHRVAPLLADENLSPFSEEMALSPTVDEVEKIIKDDDDLLNNLAESKDQSDASYWSKVDKEKAETAGLMEIAIPLQRFFREPPGNPIDSFVRIQLWRDANHGMVVPSYGAIQVETALKAYIAIFRPDKSRKVDIAMSIASPLASPSLKSSVVAKGLSEFNAILAAEEGSGDAQAAPPPGDAKAAPPPGDLDVRLTKDLRFMCRVWPRFRDLIARNTRNFTNDAMRAVTEIPVGVRAATKEEAEAYGEDLQFPGPSMVDVHGEERIIKAANKARKLVRDLTRMAVDTVQRKTELYAAVTAVRTMTLQAIRDASAGNPTGIIGSLLTVGDVDLDYLDRRLRVQGELLEMARAAPSLRPAKYKNTAQEAWWTRNIASLQAYINQLVQDISHFTEIQGEFDAPRIFHPIKSVLMEGIRNGIESAKNELQEAGIRFIRPDENSLYKMLCFTRWIQLPVVKDMGTKRQKGGYDNTGEDHKAAAAAASSDAGEDSDEDDDDDVDAEMAAAQREAEMVQARLAELMEKKAEKAREKKGKKRQRSRSPQSESSSSSSSSSSSDPAPAPAAAAAAAASAMDKRHAKAARTNLEMDATRAGAGASSSSSSSSSPAGVNTDDAAAAKAKLKLPAAPGGSAPAKRPSTSLKPENKTPAQSSGQGAGVNVSDAALAAGARKKPGTSGRLEPHERVRVIREARLPSIF